MANIIVVSFTEETKAIEALHKMKELDSYGDITLYEHMMIRKKENDHYEVLNDETTDAGWRTLTGMALGGLVGAFAGPIGLVVGLYSGTAVGAILDIGRYDFEDDFIHKVNNKMKAGEITIVAEVGEDSSVFIDNYLKPLDAKIMRTDAGVEFDTYMDEQIEELEEEIEDEREKLKKATADEKVKISAKIAELKAKRKAKIAELEAKRKSALKDVKDKTKARIEKLESNLNKYEDNLTDSITQARANRLKKRINRQKSKLNKLNHQLEEVLD
ncbi:DUF1269 domain-containing protein [Maribacter sp. 2307ULW6-5]|uniref:DUF1269 domain-containing protein n=1 Tax=Maribacter sp. 2307ULW6-5 TaxID=3386275 RepID=UPI0039BD8368